MSKKIALTFDDGPSGEFTRMVLDLLEQYKIRATFMIQGNKIMKGIPEIKRAKALGCQFGNHTYSHVNLTKCSTKVMNNNVRKTEKLLKRYCGIKPLFMRPPFGAVNRRMTVDCKLPMITWSIDSLDWKTNDENDMIERVLSRAQDGDIVLMHDWHLCTPKACEVIIPKLLEQGFEFVTVPELMEANSKVLERGVVYQSNR